MHNSKQHTTQIDGANDEVKKENSKETQINESFYYCKDLIESLYWHNIGAAQTQVLYQRYRHQNTGDGMVKST